MSIVWITITVTVTVTVTVVLALGGDSKMQCSITVILAVTRFTPRSANYDYDDDRHRVS